MKKILLITTTLLLITTPCRAGILSVAHTAAIMLGESRTKVLTEAEHLLGTPLKSENMPDGEKGEFEQRYYQFTEDKDIVLIFHQDKFFQLIVDEKTPNDLPFITDMSNYLKGYFITKTDKKIELKLLGLPHAKISPDMLTTKALDIAWEVFGQKNYQQARMLATTVIQKFPGNAEAVNLLGNIELHENQLEASINHFKDAIAILEKQQEKRTDYILNNLGMTYFKAGQLENAHQTFEKSIAAANDLNCAGRIGDMLALLSLDKVDQAKKITEPCKDKAQVKKTVESMFEYFELSNEPLKEKVIGLLK